MTSGLAIPCDVRVFPSVSASRGRIPPSVTPAKNGGACHPLAEPAAKEGPNPCQLAAFGRPLAGNGAPCHLKKPRPCQSATRPQQPTETTNPRDEPT